LQQRNVEGLAKGPSSYEAMRVTRHRMAHQSLCLCNFSFYFEDFAVMRTTVFESNPPDVSTSV
jgi:hypothetical protein